jgi:undecaprenyl-diphosphatase
MDTQLVELVNRWFTANAFRADLSRALAIVPLVLIGVLIVLAWSTPRSDSSIGRSELLLGVVAAVGALLLNLALGHLYYRARPLLVLHVRPMLPEAVDSSLFSDHLAVAGAAVAALFASRRTIGWIALGLGVLLAIGRIGAGVQYSSDCLVGAAVGAACFLLVLPLRGPISRALAAAYPGTGEPEAEPEHAFTHRHRRGISIAIALLLFGTGYGLRAIQDHGWKSAALRSEAILHAASAAAPPAEYATIPIQTIAAGQSRATYATAVGDMTQVSHELDGDYHIRVQGQGAFLVLEIMPEFPLVPSPHRSADHRLGGRSPRRAPQLVGAASARRLGAGERRRSTWHQYEGQRLTNERSRGQDKDFTRRSVLRSTDRPAGGPRRTAATHRFG